jgi:hypothetical protein
MTSFREGPVWDPRCQELGILRALLLIKEPPNGFRRPGEVEMAGQFHRVVFQVVGEERAMINTLG